MPVKRKISKADYEALSDDRKADYKENPSRRGEYVLDMDDSDNPLLTALETTKAEKQALADKVAELDAKIAELENKKNPTKKDDKDLADLEALRTSYEKKISDMTTANTNALSAKDAYIKKVLADSAAADIAGKISKVPKLLARAIRERLDVDFTGAEPKLQVLDSDGKPSAYTLDDLSKEFVANPDYADIIIGSKATGGNSGGGGGAGNPANFNKPAVPLTALGNDELRAHIASKVK